MTPSPAETTNIDSLWSELMNTPAPPASIDLEPTPKQIVPTPSVPRTLAVAAERAAVTAPAHDHVQMPSPPQAAPPILVSEKTAIGIEPVKSPVSVPRAEPVKPPPVAIHSRPLPQSKSRWALLSAAVVLAAGLGGYWLKVHGWMSPDEATVAVNEPVSERQTAPRPADPAARERSAPPAPAQVKTRVSPPRPARQAAAVTPKPRPASAPAPEPIPSASVALPALVTTLPEAPPVAASAAPPAAPQGPFFEPTDVNEAPRVASRVDPDVPEDLRGRARNEIVIVRILVSQSGRPSRVSLLRRSKTGPRVDDAVIAAVNQWTFSPARKRGEAVSCWFNMGVPVVAN